jgi:Multimeric flavodoxin WrbA
MAKALKVLVVNSSGRKDSNSSVLGNEVAEGAKAAGHKVEVVDIGRMDIKPCKGCEACLAPGSKGCIVKDDMQPLYPKVKEADVVIFSAPIYWFNMCGQIKQFIDRLFAIAVTHEEGAPNPFAKKKLGSVFVYGDTDPFNSGCVNAIRSIQDICNYTGAAWAGPLYGSAYDAGEVLKNTELLSAARNYGLGL